MDARTILRRPLLTEKATIAREMAAEYAFEVDPTANKIQIREAVEIRFDVKVKDVRTIRVRGKIKRMGVSEVEVRVNGPGSGRESAITALQAAGLKVLSIEDIIPWVFFRCFWQLKTT